jgi:hypothetical protein
LRAFSPLPSDLAVLQVQSKRGQIMPPMHGAHGFGHDFVIVLRGLAAPCRFCALIRRDLQVQHSWFSGPPNRLADVPFSC